MKEETRLLVVVDGVLVAQAYGFGDKKVFDWLGVDLRSTTFEVEMVAHGCGIPMVIGVCMYWVALVVEGGLKVCAGGFHSKVATDGTKSSGGLHRE